MLKFILLDKSKFEAVSTAIFGILAENMSAIAPTGSTYEKDYELWFKAVGNGLKNELRQIILINYGDALIGFFQYYVNDGLFMMEEVQIAPQFQGKDVFRKLFGFIFSILPGNIEIVEAYANKQNIKSQDILQRLGLRQIGESKDGNSYRYRGEYASLVDWYSTKSI